jgi:hypothetical protein
VNGEGLIIDIGDEPFEVTRYNTFLYTFLGQLATRNHIFVQTGEDEEVCTGVYVWKTFHQNQFDYLHEHILKFNYQQFLNLTQVSELDEQSYERAIKRQCNEIGDFIPEEFEEP